MKFVYTEGWNGYWFCACCGYVPKTYATDTTKEE